MVSGWKRKLFEAIEADKRKDRAIGIAAGLGPNFISQMRGTEATPPKEPSFEKVVRLCRELKLDPASLFKNGEEDSREPTALAFEDFEGEALKARLGEQFAKLLQSDPKFQRMAVTLIDDFIQSTPLKSRITKTKEKSSSIRT